MIYDKVGQQKYLCTKLTIDFQCGKGLREDYSIWDIISEEYTGFSN